MNIEIANRLVEMRKKAGLSQEQLADKLGLSRQAVSKWERAEASPDTDNLICLAKLYGVSLDDLLQTEQSVEDIIDENNAAEGTAQAKPETADDHANEGEKKEKKKSSVHIGPGGIHVVDDDEEVHIGFGGIHVTDKDNNVHIGPTGIHVDEKKHAKGVHMREVFSGIYALLVAVAYVFIGVLFNMWHPWWIIFLTIPVFSSLFDCFIYKKITKFAFPVVVVIAYLVIGFEIDGWHPWWALFLTIPVFYAIFRPIEKLWLKEDTKVNINLDGSNFSIDKDGESKEIKSFKITKDGKTIEIVPGKKSDDDDEDDDDEDDEKED